MKEITIGRNDAGQRLDKYLTKTFPCLPVSMMYKGIRTKKIKVNRARAQIGQMLAQGDVLQLFIAEDMLATPERDELYKHIKTVISVIYEDENILLCDKPAGVLCHPDEGEGTESTLIDRVKAYLWSKGEYKPEEEASFAPSLCNRLDRNTAGIVVAAKNAESLRCMNAMLKTRAVSKYYLCAVKSKPPKESGTLEGYLVKDSSENKVKIYKSPVTADAKKIVTGYRTLGAVPLGTGKGADENAYLLEIDLITGRTHQIRAQLASEGMPIIGEGKYAHNSEDRKLGYTHQALCSYKLTFTERTDGVLAYLAGKSFHVPYKSVYFLGELGINETVYAKI